MSDDTQTKARDIALEACKIFFSKERAITDVFKFIDEQCKDDASARMQAYTLVLVNISYWMANVTAGNPFEMTDPSELKIQPLFMKDGTYGPIGKETQPRLFD